MSDQQGILPPGYADSEPVYEPEPAQDGPRRRRHPVLIALAIIVAVILVVGVGGFLWADGQINPGGHRGPAVAVDIPTGATTSRIGSILDKAGVIHDATLFTLYARIKGDTSLLPGSYSLDKNSSYGSVIAALKTGPHLVIDRLTIPEGFTVRQIAAEVGGLPQLHLSAAKFESAATSGEVRSPYEPSGVDNLEGLLFPATYQVQQGDSEIQVLEDLVGAFNDQAQSIGLSAAAAQLHMTVYQVVTVASIVEREAKLPRDRPLVASVIYNRLRAGMPLGADSTQTYYLRLQQPGLDPSVSQLNEPSPYNTRLNKGLPPTPIANPGLASLRAAMHPANTNYLYFVEVNADGQLGYASDQAGFAALQAKCAAAKLC